MALSIMARGRPATPPGTWGEIKVRELAKKKFQADTRFRKFNGDVVRVRATGTSKTAATNAVKERCAALLGVKNSAQLSTTSKVSELMDHWLESKSDVRPQTLDRYRYAIENHVKPGFGNLRLNEVGPSFLDAWVRSLSPGTAGNVRTVLSGAFKMAARHELIKSNPVAVVEFPTPETKEVRSLAGDEIAAFRKQITASGKQTLIDVVDMSLSTGLRAGEVLAIRWQDITQDEDGNYLLRITGTVVYSKDLGNHRQDEGKTAQAARPIPLASKAVEIIERRHAQFKDLEMLFPSGAGTYMSESNFNRLLLDHRGEKWDWVTIHTLRKTVGSLVADELGPHKAADVLGHADSRLTERAYYERNRAGVPIRDIIDRALSD